MVAQGPRPTAVFIDFNQNTRDHTMAAAYSVRGNPRATVSAPVTWAEIDAVVPDDFTIATMPTRFAELGDLYAEIDDVAYGIETLLGGPIATVSSRRPASGLPVEEQLPRLGVHRGEVLVGVAEP